MTFKEEEIVEEGGKKYYRIVDDTGLEIWHKANVWGSYDRELGPAKIYPDGKEEWYKNGVLHRVGGPAIISPKHGITQWFLNGKRHRDDGPAYEDTIGNRRWYKHGLQHREDGPAVESPYEEEYWVNGQLHNEDGPAIVYFSDKTPDYYLFGKQVPVFIQEEWEKLHQAGAWLLNKQKYNEAQKEINPIRREKASLNAIERPLSLSDVKNKINIGFGYTIKVDDIDYEVVNVFEKRKEIKDQLNEAIAKIAFLLKKINYYSAEER